MIHWAWLILAFFTGVGVSFGLIMWSIMLLVAADKEIK
jgi:hypothetical protein